MTEITFRGLRSIGSRYALPVCATSLIALASGLASAQQPGIEEITVTATKRSTSLQDTPISITAVTGEELLDRGIGNFTALAQETPGISMRTSGPGQTEFAMRGMTSNGGTSPTVGFYLDDVPLTPPALGFVGKTVVDPNLYDLNRVEVLRGPQGTLYGAGSMGGTIKLLTNQPDSTGYHYSAEAILSGTDGGGFNHTENAMANVPLVDNKLALRAVLTEAETSGWIDRVVLNPFPLDSLHARGNILGAPVEKDYKNVNSTEQHGGRVSALYTPDDRLTIGATLFFQHIGQAGESNYDNDPGTLAHYQPYDIKEPYTDSFTMWSVNANYRFDAFDVTSVTSNYNRRAKTTQDSTETLASPSVFGFRGYSVANGGIGPSSFTEIDRTRQFSEELRVASTGDNRLQWLGGLFYSKFNSNLDYYSFDEQAASVFGTANLFNETQPSSIRQEAAFGELNYKVLDGLTVTAGARYFMYQSKIPTTSNGFLVSGGSTNIYQLAEAKDHGLDPKFNISYDIDKDLMVYATAERGFRPGGGNNPPPTTGVLGARCAPLLAAAGAAPEYRPDTVWNYEVGEKYKIGSTLTLDGALYHERWAGVQQRVKIEQGCGYQYIANLGTATVNGGELEAKWFATSNWMISGNYGYSKATLSENQPLNGGYKGQDLQDIPLMTASAALTYFFDVNGDWQASVRGSYDWTDSMTDPALPDPSQRVPSHGFANLRATMFNERWTVAAFINNLTNKHAFMNVAPWTSTQSESFYRIVSNQPLTGGIDVNVKF